MPVSQNHVSNAVNVSESQDLPKEVLWDTTVGYLPVFQLSDDAGEAIRKMSEIQALYPKFPNLDCGSCGAPTCRALAEDIVKGEAKESDCIIKLRDELQKFYEMYGDKFGKEENKD